jgi:hypothetical protein
MDVRMSKTLRATPVIEAAVILTLKAARNLSREEFEEATLYVEQILNEHVAQSASACADFEHESIEIDMILTSDSLAELHQQLAIIVGTLEENCTLSVHGGHDNKLVLMSSTTNVAQSHTLAA